MGETVSEYAARTGTKSDTIRKQLQRGKLPGYKAGGEWYVSGPPEQDTPPEQTGQDKEQDSAVQALPEQLAVALAGFSRAHEKQLRELLEAMTKQTELIEFLRAEVAELRAAQAKQLEDSQANRPWWRRVFGR